MGGRMDYQGPQRKFWGVMEMSVFSIVVTVVWGYTRVKALSVFDVPFFAIDLLSWWAFPFTRGRLGSRLSSAEWFCFVCCGPWDTGNWRQLRVAHQSHNEAVTASGLCLGLLPEKLCKTGSQKLESSGHYCIFFWEMMEWAGTHPWILYNSLKTNT